MAKSTKIAIASGKGGTGKTMLATSLAVSLASHYQVQFLDCDVEAPNAHLFLKPDINWTGAAEIYIPEINQEKCTACGVCVENCVYHALAKLGENILVFPQLCHGCGSCARLCPENAITNVLRAIGTISRGISSDNIQFFMGELTISEPMPTPIIQQLKKLPIDKCDVMILDAPPGASCAVVATVYDADYVILVTEPTPFGLHDLKQMLGVLSQTGTPGGVIINRVGIGDESIEAYLAGTPYPILMKIPYDEKIAYQLAKGEILANFMPEFKQRLLSLYQDIIKNNEGGGKVSQ